MIKNTVKKIIGKIMYGWKNDSDSYINHLKKLGMKIGEGTTLYAPRDTMIDITRPWLIDIGKNVQITQGVVILTHGYDWSVLKGKYGEVLGSSGAVEIGDNCFIGVNTTILKGVKIGSNTIIGANSLVNKDLPGDSVCAGNPCRVIMSVEEYLQKRRDRQVKEATEMVKLYRERYNKEPDDSIMREFFWLYSDNPEELCGEYKDVMKLVGNEEFSNEKLKQNKKKNKDLNDFLSSIE